MIHCVDLIRTFTSSVETVTAVAGVNLHVSPGELVCVEGASGSGKSTLLNLIAGLDVPSSGEVRVGEVSLGEMNETQRAALRLSSIGVIFQENNLIDEFTAAENVAVPLRAAGVGRQQAATEAADLLELVGVAGLARRRPQAMSGGQRQRVGIARALAGGRRILVADEPTGALDSNNSRSVYELMRRLCDDGVSVITASHDPIAREHATRTLRMTDGAIDA